MDTVLDIAQVIAMVAALAAVTYAEQAVVETRALRYEERVARLLELVAQIGEHGTAASRRPPRVAKPQLVVAQHQLRAAVRAADVPLPACEQLLDVEWPDFTTNEGVERDLGLEVEGLAAVDAALHEVAELLVRLRTQGSWVLD